MGRLSNFEISYNLLNLPTSLFCWGDYAEYYDYLADGTKVRHAYQDGQERIYAGSLVYDQGVFESAPFGGGRIVGTDNGSEVHYFLTDLRKCPECIGRTAPLRHERSVEPTVCLSQRRDRGVLDCKPKAASDQPKSCRPLILRKINNTILQ